MEATTMETKTQTIPLACSCGAKAAFECETGPDRKGRRVVRRERLVCPGCGAATGWEPASPNGEHRQDLVYHWTAQQGEN